MESDNESNSCSEDEEEKEEAAQILYDIVTYREWEQEPEILKNNEAKVAAAGRFWSFGSQPRSPLSPTAEKLLASRLPWQFAVSSDANLVAVLQDASLEVWSSKDNYGTLIGRRPVARDLSPAWRHLAWTQDCSLLAVGHSSGVVEICDTVGSLIYQIISPQLAASQPGYIPAPAPTPASYLSVFFAETRVKDKKWTSELILVEISGRINSFLVSQSGYQELSSYTVGWKLSAAAFSPTHNILVTAGSSPLAGKSSLLGRASHAGLVAFRLINDSPHFISIMDEEEFAAMGARSFTLPFLAQPQQDHVVRLAVSNCGRRIAAVHESGSITVWLLPGLMLESCTRLSEQPGHDEINPQLLQASKKSRAKLEFLSNPVRFHPVDISWWNRESLIISRISGALSVLRMEDLCNLLGDAPEFLDGVPSLSQAFEKGFFALECESAVKGRRHSCLDDSAGEDPDQDLELESEDEDSSWLSLGKRSAAAVAYFMTDNERFAPPKKRSKVVKKTYRLIALVSTTPEELYSRKIAAEEYGEAIMLAQHYRLDTDAVYERQWRMSKKSVAAIHDYLGKIKRRVTVLKECLETIPEDVDAARELLRYGLEGTELESLIALNTEDNGLLVRGRRDRTHQDDWEEAEEEDNLRADKEREARLKLIAKVKWESLTVVQKDMIQSRLRLLYYLDILDTYEEMLGGGQRAADRFRPEVFRRLRSQSPIENCLQAARQSEPLTIAAFFSGQHSEWVLPNWLAILSWFPETTPPHTYQDLLPALSAEGAIQPWLTQPRREQDWAEQPLAVKWSHHKNEFDSAIVYSEEPCLKEFQCARLSPELASRWYATRARQIATRSNVPELALELLQKGLERDIQIDLQLMNNLRTLEDLVYEVQLNKADILSLEELPPLAQMRLLISRSLGADRNPQRLLSDVRSLLLPYLQRLEDLKSGELEHQLRELCLATAAEDNDISLALLIVQTSTAAIFSRRGGGAGEAILSRPVSIVRLGLDSCYAQCTGGQMDLADQMLLAIAEFFEVAPGRPRFDFIREHGLNADEFRAFVRHLDIVRLFAGHGVVRPLALFRDRLSDRAEMQKVLEALTRRAEGARPPLDQDGWRAVLRDLQKLQKLIPVVPIQDVFSRYCESLLSSGSSTNISLAGDVMRSMVDPQEQVSLIVAAWSHYYSNSTNHQDPQMDLARQCLSLATVQSKEIQECADLTSALQSLADFGLCEDESGILPVRVLRSRRRLDFVQMALEARPTAYRNSQRLMKLATLLRAENIENLEGVVWALVAKKALKVKDYQASYTACSNFISAGYSQGWDISYQLAVQAEFDIEKCNGLLAFALTHCEEGSMEEIILSLLRVEQRSYGLHLGVEASNGDAHLKEHGNEVFEDIVEDASSREASPLAVVSDVKQQLLSVTSGLSLLEVNTVSRKVWDRLVTTTAQAGGLLGSTHVRKDSEYDCAEEPGERTFLRVSWPAFYTGLLVAQGEEEKGLESRLEANYQAYAVPKIPENLALVRAVFRCEIISQVMRSHLDDGELNITAEFRELLVRQLSAIAREDVLQGLSLLLAVSGEEDLQAVRTALPQTLACLCLIITHLALLIVSRATSKIPKKKVLKASPLQLVKRAAAIARGRGNDFLCEELRHYLELAADHRQAGLLRQLSGDIDVGRFTQDQEYKEDTILGLARFLEEENWNLTGTLANRYRLDMWTVAATHLETILLDSPSVETATSLIAERRLVSLLQSQPEKCADWCTHRIYPLLNGRDLPRLRLYYQTLEQVTGNRMPEHRQHATALDILIQNKLGVNYSWLCSGSESCVEFVSKDTLSVLEQAVAAMPPSLPGSLTPSRLHLILAEKVFFQHGTETNNWIEAFSVCLESCEKLGAGDFRELASSCLLSHTGLASVPRVARPRILKKALKFVEIRLAEKAAGPWEATEHWLHGVRQHFDKMKSPLTAGLLAVMSDSDQLFVDRLEETGGEEERVIRLFVNMINADCPPELVRQLIVIWRQDHVAVSSSLRAVVDACLRSLIADHSTDDEGYERLDTEEACSCLKQMMASFHDELLPSGRLRSEVGRLCTLESLPVAVRLDFVQLLKTMDSKADVCEKELNENEEEAEPELDSSFLAELYQLQQAVEAILPGTAVKDSDLTNLSSKSELLARLLGVAATAQQLEQLADLFVEKFLSELPSSDFLSCVLDKCRRLTEDELYTVEETITRMVARYRQQLVSDDSASSGDQIEVFLEKCWQEQAFLLYVRIVLELQLTRHYDRILQVVPELAEIRENVLTGLIWCGLGGRLADSSLYPRLVETALGAGLEDQLVAQLEKEGHQPLAIALQMTSEGIPAALRTLSTLAFKMMARK